MSPAKDDILVLQDWINKNLVKGIDKIFNGIGMQSVYRNYEMTGGIGRIFRIYLCDTCFSIFSLQIDNSSIFRIRIRKIEIR